MQSRCRRLLAALFLLLASPSGVQAQTKLFDEPLSADAPRIELPSPTGRWNVGTITFHWIDRDRQDLLDEKSNHQVIAQIWYPALASSSAKRAEYFPELEFFRLGLASLKGDRPARDAKRFARLRRVVVDAAIGTPVAPDAGRLPVLIFSPGGNMSRHFHTTLFQELASHGYLVVAMSHKYSTWDVFPAGGFSLSEDWPDEEVLTRYLAADATFVLDQLQLVDRDGTSRFANRIDTGRVAIVGHSRGGKTVARFCASDPRAGACVTMDNIGPSAERESGLDKPQMTIRSDDDRAWDSARIDELRAFLRLNPEGAREVIVHGATHNDFTDLPVVDPDGFPSSLDQSVNQRCLAEVILDFVSEQLGPDRNADGGVSCPDVEVVDYGPKK